MVIIRVLRDYTAGFMCIYYRFLSY